MSPPRRQPSLRSIAGRWSASGVLGLTLAVTFALRNPLSDLPEALAALVAVFCGWLAMLLFAPWRRMAALGGDARATRALTRTLERIMADDRDVPLSALRLERDDHVGDLGRAIHDALVELRADRRRSQRLARTMDDAIRRETHRATVHLEREASTDPLTGLGNRRALEQRLAGLFAAGRRRDDAVTAMLIDMDRFKNVNDTLGHEAGDKCLAFLGDLLTSTLRRDDCASRHGGDEFVVLLSNHTLEQAERVAQRLSALFAQMPWPYAAPSRPTLSIGLAAVPARDPHGAAELLRRADAALYEAKAAGRHAIRRFEEGRGGDAPMERRDERRDARAIAQAAERHRAP